MIAHVLLYALLWAAAAPSPRVLTLPEALQAAAAGQPQVRAAQATQRARQAGVGVALSAYLPRLDGAANYQRATGNFELSPSFARNSPFTGNPEAFKGTWQTVDYVNGAVTLTAPIYDFGKTGGNYDRAEAAYVESQSGVASARIGVALEVRSRYYAALAERDLVAVSQDTRDNQQRHVDEIGQMVAAGTRPKIDLSSAQLNLDQADLTLVRQKNAFEVAKVHLNRAMGVEGPIDYALVVPAAQPLAEESQGVDTVVAEALQARPEFTQLAAQIAQAEAASTIARAAYFPAFTGSSRINGSKVDKLPWGWNWYVGVGLTWNFFAGNLIPHQLEEAAANVAALAAQRDGLQQQVRAEVQALLLTVEETKQRVVVADHAAATSDERLQLAEGRYRTGVSSVLELDDAQVSKVRSHFEKVQAQYDLSTARARLLHAIGKSS